MTLNGIALRQFQMWLSSNSTDMEDNKKYGYPFYFFVAEEWILHMSKYA